MEKLIFDIFSKMDTTILEEKISETDLSMEIDPILEGLQSVIPSEYHGQLEQSLFQISNISEKKGFAIGMKYMARLLMECMG